MRIVVVLEGGLVQAVASDQPAEGLEVVVIDYDTEGLELDEVHHIPQSEDPRDTAEASIGRHDVEVIHPAINEYLNKIA